GLNHFVFIKDAFVNGESRFNELVEYVIDGAQKESASVKNIFSIPFEADFLRGLRLLPCPYHRYYFKENEMLS
ncbi:family 4 glycosyl hydrolase, partial [Aeromonas veronii]